MSTMSEKLAEQKKTVGSDELAAGGLTTSSRIWTSMTGFSREKAKIFLRLPFYFFIN